MAPLQALSIPQQEYSIVRLTIQDCEQPRPARSAAHEKPSGEHPSCKRCVSKSLVCEYAKEGRVRGPNKPKTKPLAIISSEEQLSTTNTRNRSSSTNASSTGSAEYYDIGQILTSLRDPRPSVSQSGMAGIAQLDSTSNHYQQAAYYPISGSSQSHRDLPCHLATNEQPQDSSTPPTFPHSYPMSEPVAIPQYQPMYIHPDPSAFLPDNHQSRPEFLLAQAQSSPLFPAQQTRTQHDGSPSSTSFETPHSYNRYRVPPEDSNTIYRHGYPTQDATASIEGLYPHSTTSRYGVQVEYSGAFEGTQQFQDASGGSSLNLTPLTPAWRELGGSGVSSSVSESFTAPISSGSSPTTTESPFSTSHSFAVPGQLGRVASLSLKSPQPQPDVQNMSLPPGALADPHRTNATGSRSVGLFEGENRSGEPEAPLHLMALGYH
ncbi:hypothetical protein FA13DRAFT_1794365 [Coprinellus micaceus]|uniref:Uncharacterized protein n=1 Tax=Coprinellus micaceus TaxID=71717 RepID=A0A4Y7T118_COPMI|nr:hypothetical protein FA13DRAFT_1794365 [Coprinellus micaceus]